MSPLSLAMLAVTGCHHSTHVARYAPPPPPAYQYWAKPRPTTSDVPTTSASVRPPVAEPQTGFSEANGTPVFTETGMASWYGTVYNKHAAADGTTFDQNAMTAAHRTLPLGTTARVTNLATGQSVLVRITDRGPFSPGRVLDLSMGAAKEIGVYRAGVAKVRIEAYAHNSADVAGRWCVQTGSFQSEGDALKLKDKLLRRYSTSKVIEFAGPTGYWVRIDPATHSKTQATEIASWIGEPKPTAQPYLVRIN